jgi:hypothetical protein
VVVQRELFVLSGSQEIYSRKSGGFENRGKLSEDEYLPSGGLINGQN